MIRHSQERLETPPRRARRLRLLRLLPGAVLLLALGISAAHSHLHQAGASTHCAVCQIGHLPLGEAGKAPAMPEAVILPDEPLPGPEGLPAGGISHDPTLPRGPPFRV